MYYGLLAPEDKQQALYQGLMGLGSGLLQGSAPSSTPKGLLGGIGQGLQGFQQGMQGYAGAMQQNKMAQVQMADLEAKRRQNQMREEAIAQLPESERNNALLGGEQYWASKFAAPKGPQSALGKLHDDFINNRIDEPTYQAMLAKATTIPGQEPPATYETVQNPFGLGGVGQRNLKTNEVSNYQAPRDTNIDHNKPYTADGKLTIKGVVDKITPDVKKLAAARAYADQVRRAVILATEQNNPQAALAAMIRFQKALDDGAVVREGDIAISKSAASLQQQISAMLENVQTGNPFGNDMLYQMVDTMDEFVRATADSVQMDVDDYYLIADKQNYDRDAILPQTRYDRLFAPVESLPRKTTPDPPPETVVPPPDKQADAGVDYSTMSTEELTEIDTSNMTAEQRKALIDEVNKRLTTPPKPLQPQPKSGG